jgi:hypothetical protein
VKKVLREKAITLIAANYLGSSDFNGLPAPRLQTMLDLSNEETSSLLQDLIGSDRVCITHPGNACNPHIKAGSVGTINEQIASLTTYGPACVCLYPTKSVLLELVDPRDYEGKPYTLLLALGEPQLDFRSFDLRVLEYYRNDPRYAYENTDIDGRISMKDRHYNDSSIKVQDKILLNTFGFSLNKNRDRAVMVFLHYLSQLSPEHQTFWKSQELQGEFIPHPGYWTTHVEGRFPDKISVFSAVLSEMQIINEMSVAMNRPPFFYQTFSNKTKPREFTFLIRPTQREYDQFILTLDKMLSDNIDKGFFREDVVREREDSRKDGKVVVSPLGSLTLLRNWLDAIFITDQQDLVDEMIATLRNIREQRSPLAHTLIPDDFDTSLLHRQRTLMIGVYRAVRFLRSILQTSPECSGVSVPKLLEEGSIWPF